MYTLNLENMTLAVDFARGQVASLLINGVERVCAPCALWRLRLRDLDGNATVYSAYDATAITPTADGAIYAGFALAGLCVQVHLAEKQGSAAWRAEVRGLDQSHVVEWLDFPLVSLPALKENNREGNGGMILYPYNEGALISNNDHRNMTDFRHWEPEYPSLGCYGVFPNMICSQMQAYLWEDAGLYFGAHDPLRGVKGIDFYAENGGITMQMRLFCGVEFGQDYIMDYDIVWRATDARWESAAEIYREWFETALPPRAKKIKENDALPAWYAESPLVVTYCVRGVHDMDEMAPNALFPYTNALPLLERIKSQAQTKLMVLLMHWEGTAPWAPPYVWPPYGGVDNFTAFKDALHAQGDLLGVYCSGFGYTLTSNLVDDYDCSEICEREGLTAGMCAGPDGKVAISRICTGQRKGYDICPASEVGHDILAKAYEPLFESGIDYAQILDQNHGGGQYFCYSREHGHPPVPGAWMTANMQSMLTEWNGKAGNMLLGCESAAAEPFMGNLLMSDNRFELNYHIGVPVPLYAYLYHEYLRNFMGNQVSCPFGNDQDTLCYRVGYSFAAGDLMTLVLTPDGQLMTNWGNHDFSRLPDREKALDLVANLCRFYREGAGKYLHNGRMIPALPITCGQKAFFMEWYGRACTIPSVYTTAWLADDGTKAQIFVNPGDAPETVTVGGREITIPARDAVMMAL